ncbi:MAG: serine hydrolase [Roseibium sp.]
MTRLLPAVFVTSTLLLNGGSAFADGSEKSPAQEVVVPVSDVQIEQALENLDSLAKETLERSGIPGMAVAVTWKGKTVFAKGYGVREMGDPAPVDAETVFQIASLSKSLAGTVVAGKVGEGSVHWEDPVTRYLPDFRLEDPAVTEMVTFGDLFSHRSGLPDHAGDVLEDLGYERSYILDRLRFLQLGKFRLDYAYTNFGLTAAAEAVAAAAGKDWATLSEDVLYKPLGMSRTSSRFDDFIARENQAVPHVRDNGPYEPLFQRMPDAQSPAGGVSSSVNDLAKWMALVLNGGQVNGRSIIDANALLQATTGQVISGHSHAQDARPSLYGFGFNVGINPTGRVTIGHSGAFSLGAATNFLMVPSLDLGIVVLTNTEPFGVPESLSRSFLDVAELGEPSRDWLSVYGKSFAPLMEPIGQTAGQTQPAATKPARPLDDYAGEYANEYFGEVSVKVTNDGLTLSAGPANITFNLAHWDQDGFVFDFRNESAPFGSQSLVQFGFDNNEQTSNIWVEAFDDYGLGTLEKQ